MDVMKKLFTLSAIGSLGGLIYLMVGGINGKILGIFVASILGLILQPYPIGAIGIMSLAAGGLIGIFQIKDALDAFASPLIWQIVTVFFIARAFIKTGLSQRIAFHIVKLFGGSSLGLGYSMVISNLALGPLIPSCSARIGGIVYPIIKSISETLGSTPAKGTARLIGSFMTMLCLYSNAIVSATFSTAMAANFIIRSMADEMGIHITWMDWFTAAIGPSLICLTIIPLILYFLYPPTLTNTQKSKELASAELKKLGKISSKEQIMIIVLSVMLLAWMFGEQFNIEILLVAFCGLSALLITEVLDLQDVLNEKEAWHTFIWLSALLYLSKILKDSGMLDSFVTILSPTLQQLPYLASMSILLALFCYTHYLFASNSAHVSTLYTIFVCTAISIGTPPLLAALIFAFSASLSAGLFYYTSTEAVILYNSNYVSLRDFFIYGFAMTTIIYILWMSCGAIWWNLINLY